MPSFYTHGNDVYSTVATAPSPATSGTSLIVQAGDGAKFSNGWAWCWPTAVQPLKSNCEIVLITNISTDTLTITRAQQGSTARSIAIGYQIAQGLTKSDIEQIELALNYAADGGASDAYAITLAPVPTAYTTGQVVVFKANTANTGAATLNVNSLGAKTIKKGSGSTDLDTGDILANQLVAVVYDGTNFQLVSPSSNTILQGTWTTWSPAYSASGSMTFSTVTTNYRGYKVDGKTLYLQLTATGTTGGSASTDLLFTLPPGVILASVNMAGGASVVDGSGNIAGYWFANTTTQIGVSRYDRANWGSGVGRQIAVSLVAQLT